METKRLYDEDGYSTAFEAVVLTCNEVEKGKCKCYDVVLDQTLFFPEEGGQSPDKGTIQNALVQDVQIKQGVITHTLNQPLEEGAKVKGTIDWTHRFNNMQQHSGEHIFSGLVHTAYGYDNVGFHLSDQIVTMDFNGVLTDTDVAEIEKKANQVIAANVPIEILYPDKEELKQMEYRSKIEIDGQVRIVKISGVDMCACCAPHVKQTGEIGGLKVMSRQNYKGGVRLSILCGLRALEAFCQKNQIVSELMNLLSEKQEGLVENVSRLKESNQALKNELNSFRKKQLEEKLASIPEELENVLVFEEDMDAVLMRNAVNDLVKVHSGICAFFAGNDVDGYRFIIGSSSKDTREVLAKIREKADVRGGGSPAMVQGSVVITKESLQNILK